MPSASILLSGDHAAATGPYPEYSVVYKDVLPAVSITSRDPCQIPHPPPNGPSPHPPSAVVSARSALSGETDIPACERQSPSSGPIVGPEVTTIGGRGFGSPIDSDQYQTPSTPERIKMLASCAHASSSTLIPTRAPPITCSV